MADIQKILSQMSIEEKCALCSGIDMWRTVPMKKYGIPTMRVSDGPHGMRRESDQIRSDQSLSRIPLFATP